MKRVRSLLVMLVVSLGVAFALIAPSALPAQASSLSYIAESDGPYCWVNNGPGDDVTIRVCPGTGWAEEATGTTWDGRDTVYLVTGSSTCAIDNGRGAYVLTDTCAAAARDYFYYDATDGALVSVYATGQVGQFQCLIVEGSNGKIGNFDCPPASEYLPQDAGWYFPSA